MKLYLTLLGLCFLFKTTLNAQVEIYKGNQDTATYIAPEDTITRAPMYGNNPDEIYRYLENTYASLYGTQYLSYYPENIKFSFYVERNGSLTDFKIIYAGNQLIGGCIEKLISTMPKWTPGKEIGKRKRTLMVYDINVQMVEDLPNVLVSKNELAYEYSNRYKDLKWFIIGGSILIMFTLWITSNK